MRIDRCADVGAGRAVGWGWRNLRAGGTTGRQLRAHHRLAHEGWLECTALAREDDTWRARCGHRDLVAVDRELAAHLRHRQRRDVDHARTPAAELVQTLTGPGL